MSIIDIIKKAIEVLGGFRSKINDLVALNAQKDAQIADLSRQLAEAQAALKAEEVDDAQLAQAAQDALAKAAALQDEVNSLHDAADALEAACKDQTDPAPAPEPTPEPAPTPEPTPEPAPATPPAEEAPATPPAQDAPQA